MRVVLDTNVLVSAIVLPGRSADQALRRIIEGRDELVISKAIVDELLGVLARKFARDAEQLARVAVLLAELGEIVSTKRRLSVLADEPDNRILECAVAGSADAIVTGDRAMLALGQYEGIAILTLRKYLAAKA